jgi:protein SCO1/2
MKRIALAVLVFAAAFSSSASEETTDLSVYQLGDRWTDQDGRAWTMHDLQGNVVVLSMFFASCQYVCPRITTDMQAIEAKLGDSAKDGVRFVLASFDTERDLPPALKTYQEKMRLPADRWTLLHGGEDAVRNLAAVLGVKYNKDQDGAFGHSVIITVLDRDGEIVHQEEGLGADPAETIAAIEALTK